MQKYKGLFSALLISIIVSCLPLKASFAQELLYKRVTVQAYGVPLENVLERIGRKCGFDFSYSSSIVPRDSLVNVSVTDRTVKDILDILFEGRFEYKEAAGYVILRYAPLRLSLITDRVQSNRGIYRISGYVVDDKSGEKIARASVYEKRLLRSALTASDGSFEIRLNTNNHSIALTVSKESYRDTTVLILPAVNVNSSGRFDDDYYESGSEPSSERTTLGRWLVSYRQKIQELNVPGFLAHSPIQASLTPGLSSHGMLSGQVINKFSFNLLGGYTAGVEGVEAAGMFNINKRHARGAQAAGLFNLVGESVTGAQAAGIYNGVLGSVQGVQAGGFSNFVIQDFSGVQAAGMGNFTRGAFSGVQASGLLSFVGGTMKGIQAAGLINASIKDFNGVQAAGIVNIAANEMRGVQMGLVNITRRQQGLQVGLVNVADTSSGASLGLINIVRRNGIHTLSWTTNELTHRNLTLRTGRRRLYTVIQGSEHILGMGLGRIYDVNDRFYVSPELIGLYVYQGSSAYTNTLLRFPLNLNFKINSLISITAGPVFNLFYSDQEREYDGYKQINDRVSNFRVGKSSKIIGWFGWTAGVNLF